MNFANIFDFIFLSRFSVPLLLAPRYQHLGKAGSQPYIHALEQITRRAKIEALDRSIESLNLGLKDLIEETSKYRQP
ncbi:hypothetical protein [Nostoc sp.]|uniref:hypothetical protein n=1 Tax=Nostoc sp. TaxID=1180 RepID=UPI002FF52BD0